DSLQWSLAARLSNATEQTPAQLPLLQPALARMWSLAAARNPAAPRIQWDDADRVGGLSGALDQHAETIFEDVVRTMGPGGSELVEAMFAAITERRTGSSGGQDVRRPQRLSGLAAARQRGNDWRDMVPVGGAL